MVYAYTPIQLPFDEAAAATRIRVGVSGEESGRVCFRAITVEATPVGEVAAYRRSEAVAALSYVVGADHRGQGIAAAAVREMMPLLEELWSVRELVAEISPENYASISVAESVGFQLDRSAVPIPRTGKQYSVLPWRWNGSGFRPS
jgi:RimJ/RimL family protein N-acetyltransferase